METFSKLLGLTFSVSPFVAIGIGFLLFILGVGACLLTKVRRGLKDLAEHGRLRFPEGSYFIINVTQGSVRDIYSYLGDRIVVQPIIVQRVSPQWKVIRIRLPLEEPNQGSPNEFQSGWVAYVPQCCSLSEIRSRLCLTAVGAVLDLIREAEQSR